MDELKMENYMEICKLLIYYQCKLKMSEYTIDEECKRYFGCKFKLNEKMFVLEKEGNHQQKRAFCYSLEKT